MNTMAARISAIEEEEKRLRGLGVNARLPTPSSPLV
jgi:hypothetical protein